jgi:hypothetical protein
VAGPHARGRPPGLFAGNFPRPRNLGRASVVQKVMTRLRGTLIAAAVPLILLGACARTAAGAGSASSGPSGEPGSAPAASPGADELVLRTESYGGFVPAGQNLGRIPGTSVYGDGRVISEGPTPAIYPGPALPNVQVQRITPELVRELIREGVAAGVRNGVDLGQPGVADAPTTKITVVTADGPQIVAAVALSEAPADDPRLTAAQRQARTKLAAFDQKLSGLTVRPGASQSTAYQPARIAVLASPYTAPTGLPASPAKAWPGPALPGTDIDAATKAGCVVVSGPQTATVLAAAKGANAITPWTAGSAEWHIVFRPLLPDEDGCAAVKGTR